MIDYMIFNLIILTSCAKGSSKKQIKQYYQGEYGHDWQHGSQTIMDTTIEYDECSHCHMRKNEVEIDNSQVRANDYDYYTIYDDIYDNRNKKSKVLTRRV